MMIAFEALFLKGENNGGAPSGMIIAGACVL